MSPDFIRAASRRVSGGAHRGVRGGPRRSELGGAARTSGRHEGDGPGRQRPQCGAADEGRRRLRHRPGLRGRRPYRDDREFPADPHGRGCCQAGARASQPARSRTGAQCSPAWRSARSASGSAPRFLLAEESRALPGHQDEIIRGAAEDFIITRAYTGKTARDYRNDVIKAWDEFGLKPVADAAAGRADGRLHCGGRGCRPRGPHQQSGRTDRRNAQDANVRRRTSCFRWSRRPRQGIERLVGDAELSHGVSRNIRRRSACGTFRRSMLGDGTAGPYAAKLLGDFGAKW